MELKTLKEITLTGEQRGFDVSSIILRQEAINWIKEDIKDYRKSEIPLPKGEEGRLIHNFIVQQRRKWKERFNITEEDLKK